MREIDDSINKPPKFNYGLYGTCCSAQGYGTLCFICLMPICAIEEIVKDTTRIRRPFSYLFAFVMTVFSCCCWGPILGCSRKLFRRRRGIRGSICLDCCIACILPCCTITQMLRDLRENQLDHPDNSESGSVEEDEN
ncbi:unnamed protein product [Schistosoma rodhaini]|uniref:G_PROTEIN_RECEP_F1_2 domain-containing protein n=1 Tax=Schistosoma rodhaini TaxID=6188 RepID=A0A183QX99_9TREM|nr:unnamed protein product [Schistosoma rodhaini]